jgi:hypothetical protein
LNGQARGIEALRAVQFDGSATSTPAPAAAPMRGSTNLRSTSPGPAVPATGMPSICVRVN